MKKIMTTSGESRDVRDTRRSVPHWETLETYAREQIQAFVQRLLEAEVEELLGRAKSQRRSRETPVGYRNGSGKPRQLALMNGAITIRRPRVRDLEEHFVSRVLPVFKRRTAEVGALLPELYLHGLALGDFELALRGLLGDAAPLSPSVVEERPWGPVKTPIRSIVLGSIKVPMFIKLGEHIKVDTETHEYMRKA